MIEWLAPGFIYSLIKDGINYLRNRNKSLTPSQILERRQRWKPLFQEEIAKTHADKLRKDAIIRDVRRLDQYPNISDEKGISPWFRVGLMGTYHRGILVWLSSGSLCQHGENEYRFPDYKRNEQGDVKVALIGKIPFERIESVDWDGDEYYYFPHIYCHFDAEQNEPYEVVMFCTEIHDSVGRPRYIDLVPYKQVRDQSKKLGIDKVYY